MYESLKSTVRPYKIVLNSMKTNFFPYPYRKYMHKHKIIFIHIPRTGGTSVLRYFSEKETGRDHSTWFNYLHSSPYAFNSYYKFAIVRNPWDRTLSAYKYLLGGGNKMGDLELMERLKIYEDFNHFVKDGLLSMILDNVRLFLPQIFFVCDGKSNIMVDKILRFENYQDCVSNILPKIKNKKIEKINSSERGDYKDYYNEETINIVKGIYKNDIENFEYKF